MQINQSINQSLNTTVTGVSFMAGSEPFIAAPTMAAELHTKPVSTDPPRHPIRTTVLRTVIKETKGF
jgi:hypothetical protein